MSNVQLFSLIATSLSCLIAVTIGVRALWEGEGANSPLVAWIVVITGVLGLIACAVAVVLLSQRK